VSLFKKAPVEEPKAQGAEISHHSLVELFQERNTLKRKLDEAEAERAVLRADVTDLGKRYEEVQRQLTGVEKMLTDPEKGQNAILYYRLRAVWDLCRNQIRGLAEELSGRQDQVERKRYTDAYEQQRATQFKDTQRLIEILDRDRQNITSGIAQMEREIVELKRFWHKKKRERLMADVEQAFAKLAPIDKRRMELVSKLEQIKKAPVPTYLGIGIPARRAVNSMLIAMAQYLYLHFTEHDIAHMARSAGTKPVMDVHFGLANDCLKIGAQMWEVVMKLKADTLRPEKLKHRAEYLRQKLTYASDQDSVPEPNSLDYLLPSSASSPALDTSVNAIPVNVLSLNYWDLETLLLKPPEKIEQSPAVKSIGSGD
jgi:predicted  nucleic acid-binding Zn-ribbon protein